MENTVEDFSVRPLTSGVETLYPPLNPHEDVNAKLVVERQLSCNFPDANAFPLTAAPF